MKSNKNIFFNLFKFESNQIKFILSNFERRELMGICSGLLRAVLMERVILVKQLWVGGVEMLDF